MTTRRRARISPYVTSLEDDVFALAGLPEEVIAVLFAYYSRSKDDLRTNLARLLTDVESPILGEPPGVMVGEPRDSAHFSFASEKARQFHEKWVVGYGHASVAEHAVVHLAIEGVSIVATKVIEDLRLGAFTEKSTRYVVFDKKSFVTPPGLTPSGAATYNAACERLFDVYLALMPRLIAELERRVPRAEGATDVAHAGVLRAHACDLLRGLLPAGTRTNLGLTANARALEGLISKMLSDPLAEVVATGVKMRDAARHVAPTLLKYVDRNVHRAGLQSAVSDVLRRVYTPPVAGAGSTMVVSQPVRLVRYDKDALERVALALAYAGSVPETHASGLIDGLRHAAPRELAEIVEAAFAARGPHDPAPRGLEASSLTFELMLDFGAYRDLQRHRMLSPATQRLTCRLGFETPSELVDLGFADPYMEAMSLANDAWGALADHPLEAQYLVPLAFRVRTLWTLNLRELFHVIELRSSRQGHASYRRIAQALYRTVTMVMPWLKDLIRVDLTSHALARG